MGTNLEFLFFLGGVLDIGLEISALTFEFLPLPILAILAFNSSLFLFDGHAKSLSLDRLGANGQIFKKVVHKENP